MRQNATEIPSRADWDDGKGRRGLTTYLRHGYIPMEDPVLDAFHKGAQVSRTLEYAYDDFCVGEFARLLGKSDDAAYFYGRARNYRNVYDGAVGFMRGRYADGTWVEPFNPANFYPWLTEATPWIYSFHAPHDMHGLIELMGGADVFTRKLDTFFYEKHYKHDNEPSHNHAFLYCYARAPWKTQARVRRILRTEYLPEPDGLSGNDDAGQMSAWYVFAAMGFYPTCPGMPIYVITSPLFDRVTVHLDPSHYEGQSFTVEARNNSERNKFIQRAQLNGQEWNKPWFSHDAIRSGGRLILEMGPEPNYTWGSGPEDVPPSLK
jgi:predicted alpha-1,2-mannosidase